MDNIEPQRKRSFGKNQDRKKPSKGRSNRFEDALRQERRTQGSGSVVSPRGLLREYLKETGWPALDKWFSRRMKEDYRMDPQAQEELWKALKVHFLSGWRTMAKAAILESGALPLWWGRAPAAEGELKRLWLAGLKIHEPAGAVEPPRLAIWDFGLPPWLAEDLQKRCQISSWDQASQDKFLNMQTQTPPLYARLNFPAQKEEILKSLVADGYHYTVKFPENPDILLLEGRRSLFLSQAYREGKVEIQDAASQLLAAQLPIKSGQRVLDLCAGRGGKSLQIASLLDNRGVVAALDLHDFKLEVLKLRARKAGFFNIRNIVWDGVTLPHFGKEISAGLFDCVLADVPCSGSGTWRRDPEGRFRLTPESLEELSQIQRRLIRTSYTALKADGYMVYATCSWLPRENEDICEEFVKETGAKLVRMKLVGAPEFDGDTMFYALFQKPKGL